MIGSPVGHSDVEDERGTIRLGDLKAYETAGASPEIGNQPGPGSSRTEPQEVKKETLRHVGVQGPVVPSEKVQLDPGWA